MKVKAIHLRYHDPADFQSLSSRESDIQDPEEGVADGRVHDRDDEGQLQIGPGNPVADVPVLGRQRDVSKFVVRRRVVPSRRTVRTSSLGVGVTNKPSPQVPRYALDTWFRAL